MECGWEILQLTLTRPAYNRRSYVYRQLKKDYIVNIYSFESIRQMSVDYLLPIALIAESLEIGILPFRYLPLIA